MTSIKCKLFHGQSEASYCLGQQLPQIVEQHPELGVCHHGTLNVQLSGFLLILNPDFAALDVTWRFRTGELCTESFSFLRVKFVSDEWEAPAWVYISSGSPYRANPSMHEVVAAHLPNLNRNAEYRIVFERRASHLPTANGSLWVV